jgi:3D (Asp-Asp-Asp) domain-containing protein
MKMTEQTRVAISFSLIVGLGIALMLSLCWKYEESAKTIRVSAYCPCEICCGKWADGQTASGYWIQPGDRFVAAPKHIPFGTKFIVPGYNNDKPVEIKDRGGAITVGRLDIFFGDADGISGHQRALNWGVQYLVVRTIGE